jgi:FkbM family methyltransferase
MNQSDPLKSFSQYGEDKIVLEFFGGKKDGFFVEVGACEPEFLSQTVLLERIGWRGILIEPQSECCIRLREKRPGSLVFQVACGAPEQRGKAVLKLDARGSRLIGPDDVGKSEQEEVQVMTLDDILKQASSPQIDFVSIDVEGLELDVLRGFDLTKSPPRLIIIEDNWKNRLKVYSYLKKQGYKLVKRTGCNNWYVPKGEYFPYSGVGERIKLFRKMHIGTPFRKLRFLLTGH